MIPLRVPVRVPVRVSVFPGGFNWPLFAGQARGFFVAQGLELAVEATAGSMAQMTDLAAGRFEVAMTAIDNIVAYVEGDGEAPIGAQPDFFAFLGSDDSFLSLVAQPGIATTADLRGRALSVDAATTGYAFALFEMLAQAGLRPGDTRVVRVGGMTQRWDDLRAGGSAATLLSAPYDILAHQSGFTVLARASAAVGAYQGNVAAARRSWAAAHPEAVHGFIRGYVRSVAWLYDPANRSAACDILQRNVAGLTDAMAAASHAVLLDPVTGFFRDGQIRMDGVRTVLELRQRHGAAHRAMPDPARYVDLSYWARAAV